jgi:hypothetical protein
LAPENGAWIATSSLEDEDEDEDVIVEIGVAGGLYTPSHSHPAEKLAARDMEVTAIIPGLYLTVTDMNIDGIVALRLYP